MNLEVLSRERRIGIFLICCLSLFIVGLDVTVVNVALPSIGRDLGGGISGLQWTVDAYTVVLASMLIFSGSVGDRFGRRRTFALGLTLFAAASGLCSLAPSVGLLVAFRALQAVGASMLTPVALSIVTNTFTDPRERAQAIGAWGSVFGIAIALGPIVGGSLVSAIDWRAIFWVNIPVGLAAIALTLRFIPESRAPHPRRFDPLGQLLVTALLATLTYGIIEAPGRGWTSAATLATFALSVAALAGLLLHEPRRAEPLIDLRFFHSIPFSAATATAVAAFAAFGGFLFLNTLYLQEVRGLSPLQTGLATLPLALMNVLCAPLSGRIVGRRGPRLPLVLGGACLLAACAMLTELQPGTSFAWLLTAYVVFGIGSGMVNPPITNAAVSGMPRAQAGVAAAVTSTSRQVGQTLGVALAGAIVASHVAAADEVGLAAASHPAWWVLAGAGAVVLVLGFLATGARARASAQRTAAELNPEALAA